MIRPAREARGASTVPAAETRDGRHGGLRRGRGTGRALGPNSFSRNPNNIPNRRSGSIVQRHMRLTAVAVVTFAGCVAAQTQPDAARVSEQAVLMLRDGQENRTWSLLRQGVDNTTRSFVIRDIPRLSVSPDIVIRRLRGESDVSVRRALILTLGGYGSEAVSSVQRESITPLLRQWYETDPDSGVHSAVHWLLHERGYGSARAQLRKPLSTDRRWYVTAEGQTMATFAGLSSVRMGSSMMNRAANRQWMLRRNRCTWLRSHVRSRWPPRR